MALSPPASVREHILAALVRCDEGAPRMMVRLNLLAAITALDEASVYEAVSVPPGSTMPMRLVPDPELAEGTKFSKVSQAI